LNQVSLDHNQAKSTQARCRNNSTQDEGRYESIILTCRFFFHLINKKISKFMGVNFKFYYFSYLKHNNNKGKNEWKVNMFFQKKEMKLYTHKGTF